MLERITVGAPDALMEVTRLYREDPRPEKIDLGLGTYRDPTGATPVMAAVKKAERHLVRTQATKSYLRPCGDTRFTSLMLELILPAKLGQDPRIVAIQTPGGTGAFRIGAELIRAASPGATVLVGLPTWPNHVPILDAVGLRTRTYPHYDLSLGKLCFDETADALMRAEAGDVVVLHASCHNPSGADFTLQQWRRLAGLVREHGLVPFLDLAYHGMGRGLTEDMEGPAMVLESAAEALVALSCSKSFGLYRDRVGALIVLARDAAGAEAILSRLEQIARVTWSMPPDHGAAVVRTILESSELGSLWRDELGRMRGRVGQIRARLAGDLAAAPFAPAFGGDRLGMFALLPLAPEQIQTLRVEHAIYLASNGRMNIAGLKDQDLERFAGALGSVL